MDLKIHVRHLEIKIPKIDFSVFYFRAKVSLILGGERILFAFFVTIIYDRRVPYYGHKKSK